MSRIILQCLMVAILVTTSAIAADKVAVTSLDNPTNKLKNVTSGIDISAPEHDILDRLITARKSGDLSTVNTLIDELDAMHGVVPVEDSSLDDQVVTEFKFDAPSSGEMLDPMQFTEDVLVNDSAEDVFKPSMVGTPEGHLFVAMNDRLVATSWIRLYRSTDGGKSWSKHGAWRANGGSTNPSITFVADPTTKKPYIFIAYEGNSDSTGAERLVIVTRVSATNPTDYVTTAVTSGITMNGADDHIFPEIATDYISFPAAPNLYVTFAIWGFPDKGFDHYPIYFSKSVGVGGGWSTPTDITGGSESTSWQARPDIAFGDAGLFVVYEKPGFYSTTFYTQVWVRKSVNFGSSWNSAMQLISAATRDYHPRVAVAYGSNSVVVAFTRDWLVGGTSRDTRYIYSTDGGSNWSWPIGYFSISPVGEQGVELAVSNRSTGRFIVAYASGSIGGALVYRTSGIATPGLWTEETKVNFLYNYESLSYPRPALAIDPTRRPGEDAVFAWVDRRQPSPLNIYFNRMLPLPTFPWPMFLPAIIKNGQH